MIILYYATHKYHPRPIELCGEFNSLEHFKRFQLVEEYRGWYVKSYSIGVQLSLYKPESTHSLV